MWSMTLITTRKMAALTRSYRSLIPEEVVVCNYARLFTLWTSGYCQFPSHSQLLLHSPTGSVSLSSYPSQLFSNSQISSYYEPHRTGVTKSNSERPWSEAKAFWWKNTSQSLQQDVGFIPRWNIHSDQSLGYKTRSALASVFFNPSRDGQFGTLGASLSVLDEPIRKT